MLNIAVKVEVSDTTMFIMAVKARLINFLITPFLSILSLPKLTNYL